MKQIKHIWWTFSPWEADALRQYLEQLALEGWYPESIGTIGMKCRLGEPEKRRYAAVLAPKTSVLTGVDSWDAGKFRERCEAAGWKLQYSGTNWQIFYTTDETLELTEEMSDANQFLIQKALVFGWSTRIFYPLIVVLECWLVYQYFQNPGKLFTDPWTLFSMTLSLVLIFSYGIPYVHLLRWVRDSACMLKEEGHLPVMDLKKRLRSKKRLVILLGVLISVSLAIAFSLSIRMVVATVTSSLIFLGSAYLVLYWLRKHGSGDSRENWIGYLVGVTVLCMILVPMAGAVIDHLCGNEEINENRKQTAFASYQNNDIQVDRAGNQVVVTVYKSRFSWIIQKTRTCYPKNMSRWWDVTELEVPEALSALPDGVSISWYRYNIRKEDEKEKTESQEVIAADRKTVEELQKEQNAVPEAEEAPEIVLDELILSDNNRLVILDYGGGTDASSVEEAVDGFLEPLLKQ